MKKKSVKKEYKPPRAFEEAIKLTKTSKRITQKEIIEERRKKKNGKK